MNDKEAIKQAIDNAMDVLQSVYPCEPLMAEAIVVLVGESFLNTLNNYEEEKQRQNPPCKVVQLNRR